MKFRPSLLLLSLPLLFAPIARAERELFTVNPAASTVDFTLGGAEHGTRGTFHVEKGEVIFDPAAATISGLIVVAAGSGSTGNESRDKKMQTEVLEAAHFAEISFAPQSYLGSIAPHGDSTIEVSGIFTLHGTPHQITLPMQIQISGTNCTAKTDLTVPYVKWGLKDPSIFILRVAKDVQVNVMLSGHISSNQ